MQLMCISFIQCLTEKASMCAVPVIFGIAYFENINYLLSLTYY